MLHDPRNGATYVPLQHLADAQASFEIYNSPLSEYACLGFEYGYSGAAPRRAGAVGSAVRRLHQRRADHHRSVHRRRAGEVGPDIALDAAACRTATKAPGPEHSSARLERFLQLSAEGNIRDRELLDGRAVLPPVARARRCDRSRLPAGGHDAEESAAHRRPPSGTSTSSRRAASAHVIDDPRCVDERAKVERVLLCSGKIYYDLIARRRYAKMTKTAIVRVELLSPLPAEADLALIASLSERSRRSSGCRKSRRTWARAPTCGAAWWSACRTASRTSSTSAARTAPARRRLRRRARRRARAHRARGTRRELARSRSRPELREACDHDRCRHEVTQRQRRAALSESRSRATRGRAEA